MKMPKPFLFLLLLILLLAFHDTALGWSWRELKIGITTEAELFLFGGLPEDVSLSPKDYLDLKAGKPPGRIMFKYSDSNVRRRAALQLPLLNMYNPLRTPIITEGPLRLSDEMDKIEVEVFVDDGKLFAFVYTFWFSSKFDKKKYMEIFSTMLGKPIQVKDERDGAVRIKYGTGNFTLEINGVCVSLSVE